MQQQWRTRLGLGFTVGTLVVSAVTGCDGDSAIDQGAPTPGFIEVWTGGDSFSAGYPDPGGIYEEDGTDTNSCRRSAQAPVAQLDGSFINNNVIQVSTAACSGAMLEHMIDVPQYPELRQPQIDTLTAAIDAVFFTMGGNDASLSSIVLGCIFEDDPQGDRCSKTIADATANVDSFISRELNQVILGMKLNAPEAQIFLLGYPVLLADPATVDWSACTAVTVPGSATSTQPAKGITTDEAVAIREFQRGMNETLAAVATDSGATYVPVDITGNQVCSSVPYAHGVRVEDLYTSFHLTPDGYGASREAALRALGAAFPAPAAS